MSDLPVAPDPPPRTEPSVGLPGSDNSRRLFHLDVLRGVAILLVLGQHTPATIRGCFVLDAISDFFHEAGYLGVDLFFTLSGFLIGGLLFAERDRTGTIRVQRFLVRRVFKIWPAYLTCLLVTSVAMALTSREFAGVQYPLQTVAAEMWPGFLHVQNYFPSTKRCAWFWSLGVEEHFYLLLPAVLVLFCGATSSPNHVYRVVGWLTACVGGMCLIFRGFTRFRHPDVDSYIHYFPTHLRLDALLGGVFLVSATRYSPNAVRSLHRWRWLLGLSATAVFLLPVMLPGPSPRMFQLYPFDCTLVILASMGIVLCAYYADRSIDTETIRAKWTLALLQPLGFIGYFSYSIYLWHGFFGPAISNRILRWCGYEAGGTGLSTLVHLGLYGGVTISMGVISHFMIEKPFLALRERWVPKSNVKEIAR